jgi:hypothetical protein
MGYMEDRKRWVLITVFIVTANNNNNNQPLVIIFLIFQSTNYRRFSIANIKILSIYVCQWRRRRWWK